MLLDRLADFFFVVPLLVAFLRRRNLPASFNCVYKFLVVILILTIFRRIGTVGFHNNIFSYHLFTTAEIFLLASTYRYLLPSPTIHTFIRAAQVIFIPIAIIDASIMGGILVRVNTFANTYVGTIMVGLAILHLLNLIDSPSKNLRKNPAFIFSIAILFNSTLTTAIHTLTYFVENKDLFATATDAFPYLNAFYTGLLAYAFSKFPISVEPRNALPWWLQFAARRRTKRRVGSTPVAARASVTVD